MYYNEEELLKFVSDYLINRGNDLHYKPNLQFRSRVMHLKRTLGWVKRLLEQDLGSVRKEELMIAAIFHDVGRVRGKDNDLHHMKSAEIFEDYAKNQPWTEEEIKFVSELIKLHSSKQLLYYPNTFIELIILLEADLLDEEGALGITFDFLAERNRDDINYYTAYDALSRHSAHILIQPTLVTTLGKKYWDEKREFVKQFLTSLKSDLFL